MHVQNNATGRAIYPGANPPSAPPRDFKAKEEPAPAGLASQVAALKINDLRVVSSEGEKMLYSRDQSEIPRLLKEIMFVSIPEVVVQASSAEAVSSILKFAQSRNIVVIPRGSASSPFGGSVPVAGGIVLDISRMDKVLELDLEKRRVRVEAGVRWADLDHLLDMHGFSLNTCPSAKFSTVGGWVSTGGMGLNSYSRGHLSRSVLSIEVVTPDGKKKQLTPKDPEFGVMFGSEGQLGVISSMTLAFKEKAAKSTPHLVAFESPRKALDFAIALSASEVRPAHIVFESASKFLHINNMLGKSYFSHADAILVNIEGEESENSFRMFVKGLGLKEEAEFLARHMWNERYFPMKIRKFGPGMLGSEVVLPQETLTAAIAKTIELCSQLGLEPLFESHFVEGGRVLLLCYYVTDQGNTIGYSLDAVKSMLITEMLIDMGAKPYSIGIWNAPFMDADSRSRIDALRKAKAAYDPKGIMNAGKLFSLSGRFAGLSARLFSPRFMRPALKTMLVFVPLTARLMNRALKFANYSLRPKTRTDLTRIADECAMCGACVSVCPAYIAIGDERVTARGKLLTVKAMARGGEISKEHAHRTFLCMRCKACEQVCQSKLELVAAYDLLEKELEQIYGRDAAEIEKFTRYVESMPEYDQLIERGLVIGAPKHGMGGGRSDV
jgi:FAD/FMN-containing dehydrogenase/ferredoxin